MQMKKHGILATTKGAITFNYIVDDEAQWLKDKENLEAAIIQETETKHSCKVLFLRYINGD